MLLNTVQVLKLLGKDMLFFFFLFRHVVEYLQKVPISLLALCLITATLGFPPHPPLLSKNIFKTLKPVLCRLNSVASVSSSDQLLQCFLPVTRGVGISALPGHFHVCFSTASRKGRDQIRGRQQTSVSRAGFGYCPLQPSCISY